MDVAQTETGVRGPEGRQGLGLVVAVYKAGHAKILGHLKKEKTPESIPLLVPMLRKCTMD